MRSVKRQRLSELSRLGVFASVRNSIFSAKALAAAGLALLLANIWARRHEPRLHPRPVRGDVRRPARRGGVRLRHREHTYPIGSALGLAAMTAVPTANSPHGGVVPGDRREDRR